MGIAYLCITFAVIVAIMAFRGPLWLAIVGGLVTFAALFQIAPIDCLALMGKVFTTESSLSVLLSMYLIAYLQRMLEARDQLRAASRSLDGLLKNRRASILGSCILIGLLPSPAAVLICGDLMKDAAEDALTTEQQAFTTNWLRHIPECIIPTFPSVLLMAGLSGVPLPAFMAGMLVPVIGFTLVGYLPYMRRMDPTPRVEGERRRVLYLVDLLKSLWSILLILVLVIVVQIPVAAATLIAIALCVPIYKFKPRDLLRMVRTAFETRMMVSIFLVLTLANFISFSGILETLPDLLSTLPIPTYLLFCLLFFVGSLISGSNGIIAMGTPLAFAAIPNGGVALMVVLMCMLHVASMLQPTHICLAMTAEHFGVTLGTIIRRNVLPALVFTAFAIGYYNVFTLIA